MKLDIKNTRMENFDRNGTFKWLLFILGIENNWCYQVKIKVQISKQRSWQNHPSIFIDRKFFFRYKTFDDAWEKRSMFLNMFQQAWLRHPRAQFPKSCRWSVLAASLLMIFPNCTITLYGVREKVSLSPLTHTIRGIESKKKKKRWRRIVTNGKEMSTHWLYGSLSTSPLVRHLSYNLLQYLLHNNCVFCSRLLKW